MAKRRNPEGTKFLRYFGPLLEALRKLGGSGTPDEVVEQIAADMALSDEEQNELLAELHGEAQAVGRAASLPDDGEVGFAERVVTDQLILGVRQSQQAVALGGGQVRTAGHRQASFRYWYKVSRLTPNSRASLDFCSPASAR